MSIDNLRQNTETMIEVINNYTYLCQQRDQLADLKDSKSQTKIDDLNKKIIIARQYLLQLITKTDKIVEEERNDI